MNDTPLPLIDLHLFCSAPDCGHPTTRKPFSLGVFTYATNGEMIVRVQRRDDVPEDAVIANQIWNIFRRAKETDFMPLRIPVPAAKPDKKVVCNYCGGTGHAHTDCDDCQHPCKTCEGTGGESVPDAISVGLRGAIIDAAYLRLAMTLPGVAFAARACNGKGGPFLTFVFDGGGRGVIMGRIGKANEHVDELSPKDD